MKKIFTFLVAFLTTLSGAVWGIERGSSDSPLDISSYDDAFLIDLDDCKGEYYITTNGKTNTYGIKVGGSANVINPANVKIWLINAKFDVGGSAIIVGTGEDPRIHTDVIRGVKLELVLVGENEITSDGSAAAIKLRNGDNVELTISEESTGSLNINMLGDKPIDQVAIGERGEEGLLWQDALHDCGSLTINGGTITTNGYIGEFDSHAFRMNGNGIVVAQNIETSDIHKNWLVESGIYYEKDLEDQTGLNVEGNVTINSPIPDENVIIKSNGTLTLGEGDVLDESRVTIEDGGTLNAYLVTYSKPDVTNVTVGNTPANIYCGPNTPLSTEQVTATASTGITYKFLGWTTATEGADQGTFVAVSPKNKVTDGIKDYPVFATFILTQYPLDIVTGTPLEEGFEIVYPNAAKVTVADATSDPKLAAIGAKLADDKKGVDPAGNATITEESETKTVTLTATYTDAKNEEKTENVVLNLSITKNKVDISNGTLSFGTEGGSKVYDGQAANPTGWSIKISGREEPIISGGGLTLKFKAQEDDENYMEYNPVNQGIYYAYVVADVDNSTYEGTSAAEAYTISARPMDVTITPLSAEDLRTVISGNVADLGVTYEPFNAETNRGLVAEPVQTPTISGTYTVTSTTGEDGQTLYTISFSNLQLTDGPDFLANNYDPKYKYGDTEIKDGEGIVIEIEDITPGEDTDIDDGNDDEDNNWTWDAEAKAYVLIYDGNEHGIKSITVSGAEATEIKVTYSNEEGELGEGVLPLNAGHYTAEVVVTVDETSKTGTFPLWIKHRPLGVHFNLDDYILEAGGEYDADGKAEYEPVDGIGGVLDDEKPVLEGTIKVADTPNSEGKYAVTFDGVKLGTEGNFDADNYEPTYYLNGELIELDENGNGTFGGDDDPEQGIDISEPDDETGISGIGTKRYRLYLANKDYNVVDAKADYAAEGLELFSRHDKKYTKVGGSFTVWYEKDGVANAGGYRIFWSNRANGDYKEVKFDTVSEYFQIRNVQSDVYVKIYAADGFPVGNEEISAADYRAYAQPNKIVVITPQPTDVQIISMAGAVVATDKVTGQREFTNLTEGVYIVRMGETVVKLQVRK